MSSQHRRASARVAYERGQELQGAARATLADVGHNSEQVRASADCACIAMAADVAADLKLFLGVSCKVETGLVGRLPLQGGSAAATSWTLAIQHQPPAGNLIRMCARLPACC